MGTKRGPGSQISLGGQAPTCDMTQLVEAYSATESMVALCIGAPGTEDGQVAPVLASSLGPSGHRGLDKSSLALLP